MNGKTVEEPQSVPPTAVEIENQVEKIENTAQAYVSMNLILLKTWYLIIFLHKKSSSNT